MTIFVLITIQFIVIMSLKDNIRALTPGQKKKFIKLIEKGNSAVESYRMVIQDIKKHSKF